MFNEDSTPHDPPAQKTVGQIIRQRREALGLTLAALAAEVGVTKGYLSMIENHRVANPPSAGLVAALERALRIADGELARAADWQNTPPRVKRQLERLAESARWGEQWARWLKSSTARRADGARNLDAVFRNGEFQRRVRAMLGNDTDAVLDAAVPVRYRVPLINKVAAGYPRDFTDLDYPARVADEYVACPGLTDPTAFAARVVGESMMPEYLQGDVVVFSPAATVETGCDCFVRLEPRHETTFKRVFFDDGGRSLRLQPLNPRFPARVVPREHVAGLYRAVWRFQQLDRPAQTHHTRG